jgi:hypothetical protein
MNYESRIKKNILGLACLLFGIIFALPSGANAAEIILSSDIKNIKVGDQFEVAFLLNTKDESINAVESAIIFPQNILELKEIKSSNSIISFWSQPPKASGNQINFSGVVPGGYAGRNGYVFSMIFQARAEGVSTIEISKIMALRNDGKGTPVQTTISELQLVVEGKAVAPKIVTQEKDTDPPEEFLPTIGRDESIFAGKYFLVFAAQDKGSGIDHYEVCEGKTECVETDSLYLLKNQSLNEEIIVKAIDKNGNIKVVTLPPQKINSWYTNPLYLVIIVGVALLMYIIRRVVWQKK